MRGRYSFQVSGTMGAQVYPQDSKYLSERLELVDKGPCTFNIPLNKDKPLRKLHSIKGRLIIIFAR